LMGLHSKSTITKNWGKFRQKVRKGERPPDKADRDRVFARIERRAPIKKVSERRGEKVQGLRKSGIVCEEDRSGASSPFGGMGKERATKLS